MIEVDDNPVRIMGGRDRLERAVLALRFLEVKFQSGGACYQMSLTCGAPEPMIGATEVGMRLRNRITVS